MKNCKTKNATSLVEVMVVLAIISVAIVAAISLVVKANTVIKSNEIEDQANSKLIEALEAVKAYDKVIIDNNAWVNSTGVPAYFSLSKPANSATAILTYNFTEVSQLSPQTCQQPYLVTGLNFKMCLQVQVVPRNNTFTGGSNYYDVYVTVVYYVSGGPITRTLQTYRYQQFCLINTQC